MTVYLFFIAKTKGVELSESTRFK